MPEMADVTALIQKMPWRLKLSYSVGHVLNDLCASMWFSYLLLFFHSVLKFSNGLSGVLMLIGQIADAVATPFIGIESDRTDDFFLCRYGRRKAWHLLGTFCVIFTFPFIFSVCIGCKYSSAWAQLVYYSAFVIIFQIGWAAVQISHLSLIPQLTKDPHERIELNAYRYAFTVISNICVYSVTWMILGLSVDVPDSVDASDSNKIGPEDAPKFRNIVLIVVGIGAIKSFIFHTNVKEQKLTVNGYSYDSCSSGSASVNSFQMTWKNWFKNCQFYQVAVLYMCTRLYVNVTQVYVPLYLQDTLGLKEESIAIIPLVSYVSGFLTSLLMKLVTKNLGWQITYTSGAVVGASACVWIYFGDNDGFRAIYIYFVAVLIGCASSTMLITSLTLTAELIGENVESGAFVYGAMSFTDKLSNGIVVALLQNFHPCSECCMKCGFYYKYILTWICGGAVVIAILTVITLLPKKIGDRRRNGYVLTPDPGTEASACATETDSIS